VGAGCARRRAQCSLEGLEAPDFTLPDVDGKPRTLSELRGKKVFLATWASLVRLSLRLARVGSPLYDELKDKGFNGRGRGRGRAAAPSMRGRGSSRPRSGYWQLIDTEHR